MRRTASAVVVGVVALSAMALSPAEGALIAYYGFENALNLGADSSTYANTGTVLGGVTSVAGRIGAGAAAFDGGASYIRVPDSASLDSAAGTGLDRTVAFWFKTATVDNRVILEKGSNTHMVIQTESVTAPPGKISWRVDTANAPRVISSNPVNDSVWHHYAATYRGDRNVMEIFIDGVSQGTNVQASPAANNFPLVIGARDGGAFGYPGSLDDVAIWSQPLSPQQVKSLASGASNPLSLPTSFSRNVIEQSDPVAYWRLDETGPGAGAADWSGNGYALNLAGGITKGVAHPLPYDPNNMAFALDGTSAYLAASAPISPSAFAGDGSYSIELWFNADKRQQADLLALTGTGTNNHFILFELETDGRIRFLHRVPAGAGGGTSLYSQTLYSINDWHHVVAVKDATEMKLYIDGVLDPIAATDATTVNGAMDIAFGRLGKNYTGRYLDGMLDEMALFDRALTAEEVMDHYLGLCEVIPEPATLSLVGLGVLALLRRRRREA